MELLRPSPQQVPAIARAMKTVALSAGELYPGARALIGAAQQFFAGTTLDLEALSPISPAELAQAIPEASLRQQLLNGMITLALVEEVPPESQMATIEAFANAFGMQSDLVRQIRHLVDGQLLIFRFCYLRRTHLKNSLDDQFEKTGLVGTAKALATTLGLVADPRLADRYAALAHCPEGSLGLALHQYYVNNGFAYPGQSRAIPEGIVSHDVTHLLSGYGTDYIGETLVSAFTAGYRRDSNAFFSALLGELMFSTGVKVIPNPNTPVDHASVFTKPEVAARFLRALERGSHCTVDLSKGFDLWKHIDEQIPVLCDRWGIEPE